jgi:hypothetical protein
MLTKTTGLVSCLLILLFCSCEPRTRTICFLLDEGYTGVFRIIEDPKTGVRPITKGDTVYFDFTGETNYVLSDAKALQSFHSLSVRYPSGETIYGIVEDAAPKRWLVRGLFVTGQRHFYYYVGPEDQLAEAERRANEAIGDR